MLGGEANRRQFFAGSAALRRIRITFSVGCVMGCGRRLPRGGAKPSFHFSCSTRPLQQLARSVGGCVGDAGCN
jgi:hypothetical protein